MYQDTELPLLDTMDLGETFSICHTYIDRTIRCFELKEYKRTRFDRNNFNEDKLLTVYK